MPTSRETKIEERRVVARRVFDALCAHHPDKYVVLVQPRAPHDPPDDLTVPKTSGQKRDVIKRLTRMKAALTGRQRLHTCGHALGESRKLNCAIQAPPQLDAGKPITE